MTIDIGQLTATDPYVSRKSPALVPAPASGAPSHFRTDVDRVELGVPAVPPPEVLEEIAAAASRARELAEANRELHFHADETSGRIIVEVRDFDGNVIRTIPPSHALDVMAGLYGVEQR